MIKKWVKKYAIEGIISDNRLGVFSKKIPSVFITHQLNVMTGNTTWITSKIHQHIIKKYKDKTALFENIRFIQVSHISEVLEHVFL